MKTTTTTATTTTSTTTTPTRATATTTTTGTGEATLKLHLCNNYTDLHRITTQISFMVEPDFRISMETSLILPVRFGNIGVFETNHFHLIVHKNTTMNQDGIVIDRVESTFDTLAVSITLVWTYTYVLIYISPYTFFVFVFSSFPTVTFFIWHHTYIHTCIHIHLRV